MTTIWKYPLLIGTGRVQTLNIPALYRVLHVETQDNQPRLWVQVDSDHEKQEVKVVCVGTGHPIPMYDDFEHIGTAMTDGGDFVWHYFRVR